MPSEKYATAKKPQTIPKGYHSVTPFIIVKGAVRFLDFMKEAFGAEEIARMPNEDGSLGHAEVRIGDSVIVTFDGKKDWPETPGFLRLYVEDCESVYRQAQKAGAVSITKPTDMPWGDRVCRVRDPFGNIWWIMTRIEEVTPVETEKRFGEKKYMEAMKYVENAEFFPSN